MNTIRFVNKLENEMKNKLAEEVVNGIENLNGIISFNTWLFNFNFVKNSVYHTLSSQHST